MRRVSVLAGFFISLALLLPRLTANSQSTAPAASATPPQGSTLPKPHSHMIISTNFELEPLLDDYDKAYPNISFSGYQIVYKSENEWPDTPHTYIVIFSVPTPRKSGVSFWEYLGAYAKIHPGIKAV